MLAVKAKARQSIPTKRRPAEKNGTRSVHVAMPYLRKWRLLRGYTLEIAGARIGVHFTTLDKWERAVNEVGITALHAIGKAYDVPPMCLMLDPVDHEIAARLIQSYEIITTSHPKACDKWLQKGLTLRKRDAKPAPTPRHPVVGKPKPRILPMPRIDGKPKAVRATRK